MAREARASARFVRISPYKARKVIDLIRGKNINECLAILQFTPKKAARIIEKVVRSAMANAAQDPECDVDRLFVYRAYVDEGPRLKRLLPRAFGRADIIQRRMSHITVILREAEERKK